VLIAKYVYMGEFFRLLFIMCMFVSFTSGIFFGIWGYIPWFLIISYFTGIFVVLWGLKDTIWYFRNFARSYEDYELFFVHPPWLSIIAILWPLFLTLGIIEFVLLGLYIFMLYFYYILQKGFISNAQQKEGLARHKATNGSLVNWDQELEKRENVLKKKEIEFTKGEVAFKQQVEQLTQRKSVEICKKHLELD